MKSAELYYRDLGQGQPIIVIHGGPDFDHTYLLPDMDRLSDSYRLIYYDQRGRGRSRGELRLEEISIEQTIEDLEGLQNYLGLQTAAILGHSLYTNAAMRTRWWLLFKNMPKPILINPILKVLKNKPATRVRSHK